MSENGLKSAQDTVATIRSTRYSRVSMALHWLIGVALLAEMGFGFLLDELAPRGTPARTGVINLHKSIGIALGLLIVIRLIWRLTHAPPPFPQTMVPWKRRAALANHRTMYACMVVQPLSGYVASNFSKYGVKFFGTAWPPWGAESPLAYAVFSGLHVYSSWLFAALIVGHIGMSLTHALIERDGVFFRIWPHGN